MGQVNFKTQDELAAEAQANWRAGVRVSAAQARIALARYDLLTEVENVVSKPGNEELAVAWEYATSFARNSPFLQDVATQLGLSLEDMDELFKAAESVEV